MQVEDKTRRIFISVVIGDDDFCEKEFLEWCENTLGNSYRYEWTVSNIDELKKNDKHFKKLSKAARDAIKLKNDYINLNN